MTIYLASNWWSNTVVWYWSNNVDNIGSKYVFTRFDDKTRRRSTQKLSISHYMTFCFVDVGSNVFQFYQDI